MSFHSKLPPRMQCANGSGRTNGDSDGEAFSLLRAQLAQAGHTLSRTETGGDGAYIYSVSRWGMVRELRDIDAVRAFARQVGVTHG